MSETKITVDALWTEKPSPENVRTIKVKEEDGLITITATDNVGSQYLMLPEKGAIELAKAITATVEQNTE